MEMINVMELWANAFVPILTKTNAAERENFGACLCMLMEEYCKTNNINVVAFSKDLSDTIEAVNDTFGAY